MVVENSVIIYKNNIAKGVFDIWVDSPKIVAEAKSGQFVDVKCSNFTLRRPISICEIDLENGRLRLVFEIRGEGTEWLAEKNVGESIDLLGPLGNGFMISKTDKPAVFVGGGIGVPPLLQAAKSYGSNATAIIGFRSASAVILDADFKNQGAQVTVCTDDGTFGFNGLVTIPLKERLDALPCSIVYACGPKQMLKAVANICQEKGIPCFVSMEEKMACGVGACLSCACKVTYEGREQNFHVCKNGPIFNAKMIVW